MTLDAYRSVEAGPGAELKVEGSRFLASAHPADGMEQARATVDSIRRRFHDARHVCFAVRAGPPDRRIEFRDDDGEPAGTAGAPILQAIAAEGLDACLVAVVRYFGGVKLGTGGLARAYGAAAREALRIAPRREIAVSAHLLVECSYGDVGAVEAVLAREADLVRSVEREFAAAPSFRIEVKRSRAASLVESLVLATAGRVYATRVSG